MFSKNRCVLLTLMLASSLPASGAMADVVAVVSANSPVASLSKAQVAAIFLGRVVRFPSGGAALPIDLVEGAPERDQFYVMLDGKSPAQLKAYWSKIIFTGRGQPPRAVANGIEMRKVIADNPAAIGYIDAKLVDSSVRVVF